MIGGKRLKLDIVEIQKEAIELDMETREIITKMINDVVKNLEKTGAFRITNWFNRDVLLEDIALDWIAKDSKEMLTELATGYLVGYIAGSAHFTVSQRKMNLNYSKLTSEEFQNYKKMTPKEQQRFLKADTTKKEVEEIREMIKPIIPKIRTAVYKTLGV